VNDFTIYTYLLLIFSLLVCPVSTVGDRAFPVATDI